jgi:hypothetical protein
MEIGKLNIITVVHKIGLYYLLIYCSSGLTTWIEAIEGK